MSGNQTQNTVSESSEKKTIILKTADGERFQVEDAVAMEFGAVKNFLDDDDSNTSVNTLIPLPNVSAQSMSKIIEYCRNEIKQRAVSASEKVKADYDREFLSGIDNEELKELLLAVNYLEIKYFQDVLNTAVAKRIENKSVEFVRRYFNIESDFTPAEEARLRNEYAWAFQGVDPDN